MKNWFLILLLAIIANSCGYVGETPSLTSIKAGNVQASGNTIESTNSNGDLIVDPAGTGNVGIGKTPSGAFVDIESPTIDEDPIKVTASTNATNNINTVMVVRRKTSGVIADNFGPLILFQGEDPGDGANNYGYIGFTRSGNDTSGMFRINTRNSGVSTNVFNISPNGVIDIPQLTASMPVQTNASKELISSAINLASSQVSGILPLANGGTGAATLAGAGIVSGPASSVDGEVALFDLTTGKLIKRATGTGFAKLTSGVLSTSATVNAATELSGIVPIANGGTNSSTALSGSSIIVSNGSAIVQGSAGTTTTVLHGNAAGAPTYGAVSLTADVSGTLPIANGGTGSTSLAGANIVTKTGTLIDNCIPTFDGTTGPIQCNSSLTISDASVVSGASQLNVESVRIDNDTISNTTTNGALVLTGNGTNGVIAVAPADGTIPLEARSTTAVINDAINTFQMRATTSGDMVNNFGPGIRYTIRDSAAVTNIIGVTSFVRNGDDTSGAFVVTPLKTGVGKEGMRVSSDGVIDSYQPDPTAKTGAATLTAAELRTRIITYNGAAANLTFPTGTDIETGLNGVPTNSSFEISVINTGAATATMTTNTNITLVGVMTVPGPGSAEFRVRKTSTNNYTIYRLD